MQYDLVFKGGGAKGMAFIGAMREFERRGHTSRRIVGTSAGAITATLLAAGYDAEAMYQALNEKTEDGKAVFATFVTPPTMDEFIDANFEKAITFQVIGKFGKWLARLNNAGLTSLGLTIDAISKKAAKRLLKLVLKNVDDPTRDYVLATFSIVEQGGLFSARYFEQWLSEKLAVQDKRYASADLATFHRLTGKDISLVATDVISKQMLVLNHRTAPGLPITQAVRMSMNIPFIWTPVVWREDWGTYLGKDISGHRIIDGGVLSNFPVRLTSSSSDIVRTVMGDIDSKNVPTIGMMLDSTLRVPKAGKTPGTRGVLKKLKEIRDDTAGDIRVTNLFTFTADLANTLMEGNDNFAVAALQDLVCHLPVGGYETLEFDMTPKRRKALIAAATKAMSDYLDQLEAKH
jgi:NTE family protein